MKLTDNQIHQEMTEECLQTRRKIYFLPGIYGDTVWKHKDSFSNARSQNIYLLYPHSQKFFKNLIERYGSE